MNAMNAMIALQVIHPYKDNGTWVFDDDPGLVREPFVSGADDVLDRLTAHIPGTEADVTVIFSAKPHG